MREVEPKQNVNLLKVIRSCNDSVSALFVIIRHLRNKLDQSSGVSQHADWNPAEHCSAALFFSNVTHCHPSGSSLQLLILYSV